ncbi:tryptophan 2,3-dioxygenase family protein [Streptomyces rubiginosohelvolus]|uniref:tryptophan 2,3-dioxygenase family protein n=1 Tax=Streptomyces TaxID=1883 RepID=UPI0021B2A1A8|nr:tryptophan 2,3-dioxygenase family protein [Streptomyces sp. CS-7]MCT6776438.1 tryptophan 2,3-dioxygenase family protein [Streptomyces sp. CS-7]
MSDGAEAGHCPAYGERLRLDELLEVARVHETPERALFFGAHQACEIWFAIVLRHLEAARRALTEGQGAEACAHLDRLPRIMAAVAQHFDALHALTPDEFDVVRATLGTSSGFQSVQFREIEFLCGARDRRMLNIAGLTDHDRARLLARLDEQSLDAAFGAYRDRAGEDVKRIHDAMAAFDAAMRSCRGRHAALAEALLGGVVGTAGSSGAAYLWRSMERTLFPELTQGVRSDDC